MPRRLALLSAARYTFQMRFLAVLALSIMAPAPAAAHDGRLDLYGCHRSRQRDNYHCHSGPFKDETWESREKGRSMMDAIQKRHRERDRQHDPHFKEQKEGGKAWGAKAYYGRLEKDCRGHTEDSCCLASVARMRTNGWEEAEEGKCPDGHQRDMLKCESSLRWCVPVKQKSTDRGHHQEPAPKKPQRAGECALARAAAIAIAAEAIKGKVSYPPDTPIKVTVEKGLRVVTFVIPPTEPPTLQADYHAQVHIDCRTRKVTGVLVGS
ncbi:MAG: hypothetical protein ABIJ96_13985 [Elusimicrobiota bacterium]